MQASKVRALAGALVALAAITMASCTAPAEPRPGRYVDEVFPEIEQVATDAVFRTAAEAPGLGTTPSKDLMLDIWVPRGDGLAKRPVMLWQFGGAFMFGDRNQLATQAQQSAHRGFVAVTIDYRIAPKGYQEPGLLAAAEQDAVAAVKWLTDRAGTYGIDPKAVVSTGASAGALNAIHMITMTPDPADIPIAGVVSLSGMNLGPAPRAGGPPVIMFSGTADTIVPYSYQTMFCEQYRAAGNVCEQHSYEGATHMGGDQEDISTRSRAFVRDRILAPLGY
jgi:acetyl esterase/lipase